MVVLDKGNSNGSALVTAAADIETYLEGGVATTTTLDSTNSLASIQNKTKMQVSHV